MSRLQYGRTRFNPWVGKIHQRRERLPTPIFWPGEFHGVYSPWGRKESDTTERLSLSVSLNDTTTGAMTVLRLTIKGQKVGGGPKISKYTWAFI